MRVRPVADADAAQVAQIYGRHVLEGLGTFEETPPGEDEIRARIAQVAGFGLPYLVAEDKPGEVAGFAYAAPFRLRAAYRYTCEDSVYVRADRIGRGVGKALLGEVLARCRAAGLRQVMAVIGDSANAGSIGLHRSLGFEHCGAARSVGFKHGRWVDIVWMQKALGDGAPSGPGLELS